MTKPSIRTLERYEERLGIKTGYAEETTNARAMAIADVRNSVSFAAMNSLMHDITHLSLILNADGTQFTVGYNSRKKVEVKYVGNIEGPLKIVKKDAKSGITQYFIKYFLLMSATGCT